MRRLLVLTASFALSILAGMSPVSADDDTTSTPIDYGLIEALDAIAEIDQDAPVGDELVTLFETIQSELEDSTEAPEYQDVDQDGIPDDTDGDGVPDTWDACVKLPGGPPDGCP